MSGILFRTNMMSKILVVAFVAASVAWGRVQLMTKDSTIDLGISSAGWLQDGQMVDGYGLATDELHNQWLQQSFLDLALDARFSERIRIVAGIEGEMFLAVPKGGASGQSYFVWTYNSNFIIDNCYSSYSFGDTASPFLSLAMGRFHYKYDPDARNLGEYLFRSGTYPAYLITNFDQPFARLTGLKLSSDLFGMLHQDLLLTFETDIPPFYDASLSYVANCDVGKFLNIGAGVEFAHLISVDESKTTPEHVLFNSNMYVIGNDTNYYTFRGIKLMGRLSFDPKPFIPGSGSFFGKDDFKIYAEAAVLGLKNYPANDSADFFKTRKNPWGYDSLKNKIPILIGLNVPTFKVLDVLSVEAEWYNCPYPNNYYNDLGIGTNTGAPVPDWVRRSTLINSVKWRWSVYLKKMFMQDHFGVVFQCAHDHMRLQSITDEAKSDELEEALEQNRMWWWMAKVVAQF